MTYSRISVLTVLLFSVLRVIGQEQVSTWSFANTIGWKGLEISYGIFQGADPYFKNIETVEQYADQTEWANSSVQAPNPFPYYYFPSAYKSLSIHGIFVPFRDSKSKYISRIEWQSGLEFQFGSPGAEFEFNYHPHKIRLHNRNLLFNNKLLVEQRISKNVKLYGGPNFKFTLIPSERLEIASFNTQKNSTTGFGVKYDPITLLNQTQFALGGGLSLGFKFNLSCRFNINLEYQYQYLHRDMQVGALNTSYHGGSIGIRYKFIKPDPNDEEITRPFW